MILNRFFFDILEKIRIIELIYIRGDQLLAIVEYRHWNRLVTSLEEIRNNKRADREENNAWNSKSYVLII